MSAEPQAQIRALRQQINGLQQLVLQGEAVQGAVLQAVAAADLLASLPPSAFHWYRRNAGASQRLLINGAVGPTYLLQSQDVLTQVMVVVEISDPGGGVRRQASTAIGPIGDPSAVDYKKLLFIEFNNFPLELAAQVESRDSCCLTNSKNSALRLGSRRKSPRITELTMLV